MNSTASSFHYESEFHLKSGQTLPNFSLAYETYGTLNKDKSNAILICHALGANQHLAGQNTQTNKLGWWDNYVGDKKPFDTEQFFIVCSNNLGGCAGSTGPNTINPKTNQLWGKDFPIVQVEDWVSSQNLLRKHLGINQWLAVAGGSLGGMQALEWSLQFPKNIYSSIIIAAAENLNAQNIAFNEVARRAIQSDKNFNNGQFYDKDIPANGLMLARMLGHITYLSGNSMNEKFGRKLVNENLKYTLDEAEFQVESYLRHQGNSFISKQNFDANTYLRMTKALDYYDPAKDFGGDLSKAVKHSLAQYLVISFSSDWRFSPQRSREIVKALLKAKKTLSYLEIESNKGHDSFLIDNEQYKLALSHYLKNLLAKK